MTTGRVEEQDKYNELCLILCLKREQGRSHANYPTQADKTDTRD